MQNVGIDSKGGCRDTQAYDNLFKQAKQRLQESNTQDISKGKQQRRQRSKKQNWRQVLLETGIGILDYV